MTDRSEEEVMSQLAAPFPAEDIEWRAGATNADDTKAMALAYITSRAVMDRLDTVLGSGRWYDEYKPNPVGGLLCGISVWANGVWITKWDGADVTQFEAVKGCISDAFKRAAVKWGIGRYLYKLPVQWVACEKRGKTIVLKQTPNLPQWALPAGDHNPRPTKQIIQELGYAEVAEELNGDLVDVHTPIERPEQVSYPRPYPPEILGKGLANKANTYIDRKASNAQRGLLRGMFGHIFKEDIDRKSVMMYLFGVESTNDVPDAMVIAALDWLKPEKDSGGAYFPNPMANNEAIMVLDEVLHQQGQLQMEIE